MRPIAKYSATRESGSTTYTLRIELSDDPGLTFIFGLSKEDCEYEIKACEHLGYEMLSTVYGHRNGK